MAVGRGYDATVAASAAVGANIITGAKSGVGLVGTPAPRLGAAAWTDNAGTFWLFGGSDGNNFLNDLWKYNHSALNPTNYQTTEGTWSHVAGPLTLDQPGVYTGTLAPGARTNAVTWTDGSGNLWLFGGFGYDGSSAIGFLNDLWKFNGTTWTFSIRRQHESGQPERNLRHARHFGPDNMPGGRQEAAGWADASGNLWLFGGEGEMPPVPPMASSTTFGSTTSRRIYSGPG